MPLLFSLSVIILCNTLNRQMKTEERGGEMNEIKAKASVLIH